MLSRRTVYGENMTVVIWQFKTSNIHNIEGNKEIAEKLLPDVIKHADLVRARMISIQSASEIGLFKWKKHKYYGYVWIKYSNRWKYVPQNKLMSELESICK